MHCFAHRIGCASVLPFLSSAGTVYFGIYFGVASAFCIGWQLSAYRLGRYDSTPDARNSTHAARANLPARLPATKLRRWRRRRWTSSASRRRRRFECLRWRRPSSAWMRGPSPQGAVRVRGLERADGKGEALVDALYFSSAPVPACRRRPPAPHIIIAYVLIGLSEIAWQHGGHPRVGEAAQLISDASSRTTCRRRRRVALQPARLHRAAASGCKAPYRLGREHRVSK